MEKNNSSNYHKLRNQKIDIFDIILSVAKHIKILITVPFICGLLTIIYVLFIASPTYSSTSKIIPSGGGGGFSQAATLAAQFGISVPSKKEDVEWSYPDIILSRSMALKLIGRQFETKKFGTKKSLLAILTDDLKELKLDSHKRKIIGMNRFMNLLDVSESKKTGIININTKAFEPVFAKNINVAVIEELEHYQLEYNKSRVSETKLFIQERIIDIEKELNLAEDKLQDFTSRNRRIDNSSLLQLEQQRLEREVTVLIGVFTTLKQQLETTKIEEVKESNHFLIIDYPETPLYQSSPKKKNSVILSVIFGLILGLGLIFFKEFISNDNLQAQTKISQIKLVLKDQFLDLFLKNQVK